jgi:hypothetical protein
MTQTVFGLTLPLPSTRPLPPQLAVSLAERMTAAAAALSAGAPAALAASVRRDAQHYMGARRRGELRLPRVAVTRACDEAALTLLRLTADAPPLPRTGERLVA